MIIAVKKWSMQNRGHNRRYPAVAVGTMAVDTKTIVVAIERIIIVAVKVMAATIEAIGDLVEAQ